MERKRLNKGIYGLLFSFMVVLRMTAGIAQAGSLEPIGPPGPHHADPAGLESENPGGRSLRARA